MATLSTHVLDLNRGRPAAGIDVTLHRVDAGVRHALGACATGVDGRARSFAASSDLLAGTYELTFDVGAYLRRTGAVTAGASALFEAIVVGVTIAESGGAYHIPLLLSPYGYSVYRGS